MRLFIALSFVLLAAAYWLASGGPGFVPEARPGGVAEVADVTVTRAESPTSELVAPPPEAGALTLAPEAAAETAAETATGPAEVAAEAAPTGPEGLPETAVAPDEALAALAPDLAAEAPPPAAAPEAPEALVEAAAPSAEPAPGATPGGPPLREVTGDRVNLREGPGTSFDVVGRLDQGASAEVIELRDGWAWVRAGGAEGWMSERFLAP